MDWVNKVVNRFQNAAECIERRLEIEFNKASEEIHDATQAVNNIGAASLDTLQQLSQDLNFSKKQSTGLWSLDHVKQVFKDQLNTKETSDALLDSIRARRQSELIP